MRRFVTWCAALVASAGSGSVALGAMANFDRLPEGFIGAALDAGGIHFWELDNRLDPNPWFAIEMANGTLTGFPGFSAPNCLAWTMVYQGPNTGFWRCGSFKFTTGRVQSFASLELYDMSNVGGNTVTLEAYRQGQLVNSASIQILPPPGIHHYTLQVAGVPFDTLKLNGSGPNQSGCFFGVVDTVVVTPEPGAMVVLLLCVTLVRRR
jgi:hypothetical protein